MYSLLAIASVLGIAFGAFLVWLRSRRERRHADVVGKYVDALMEEGPRSLTALNFRVKYAGDKALSESFRTARDLYLAFSQVQKTGD